MPRSSGAIRIRCSTGPSASSVCAKKFRRSGGATLKCCRLEIRRCFAIRYDWRNNSVLFVHNLDAIPREVEFSTGLRGTEARVLVNLLTDVHSRAGDDGKHHLLLEAYGYRWYRVGGLDYLLKRSEIETPKER